MAPAVPAAPLLPPVRDEVELFKLLELAVETNDVRSVQHLTGETKDPTGRIAAAVPNLNRVLDRLSGETALHIACNAGHVLVAGALLRRQIFPSPRNGAGRTPLHKCALHGWAQLVDLLLLYGADPEVKDSDGRTAADLAREGSALHKALSRKPSSKCETWRKWLASNDGTKAVEIVAKSAEELAADEEREAAERKALLAAQKAERKAALARKKQAHQATTAGVAHPAAEPAARGSGGEPSGERVTTRLQPAFQITPLDEKLPLVRLAGSHYPELNQAYVVTHNDPICFELRARSGAMIQYRYSSEELQLSHPALCNARVLFSARYGQRGEHILTDMDRLAANRDVRWLNWSGKGPCPEFVAADAAFEERAVGCAAGDDDAGTSLTVLDCSPGQLEAAAAEVDAALTVLSVSTAGDDHDEGSARLVHLLDEVRRDCIRFSWGESDARKVTALKEEGARAFAQGKVGEAVEALTRGCRAVARAAMESRHRGAAGADACQAAGDEGSHVLLSAQLFANRALALLSQCEKGAAASSSSSPPSASSTPPLLRLADRSLALPLEGAPRLAVLRAAQSDCECAWALLDGDGMLLTAAASGEASTAGSHRSARRLALKVAYRMAQTQLEVDSLASALQWVKSASQLAGVAGEESVAALRSKIALAIEMERRKFGIRSKEAEGFLLEG